MPHKGVHVLVQAFRQLPEPNASLRIYGDASVAPEYSAQLRELAQGDGRIRFEGSFAPDQRGAVLAELDALVVPSLWYENTPFVLLEAQAVGLPVLASDVGGMTEVVRHGIDGECFERGDPGQLEERLRAWSRDPDCLLRFSAQLRRPQAYAQHAAELVNTYQGLLGA